MHALNTVITATISVAVGIAVGPAVRRLWPPYVPEGYIEMYGDKQVIDVLWSHYETLVGELAA